MRPTSASTSASPSSSFTGSARREQITKAAIEVLASEGYAATSMAAIADRIGVSKGILSYHFASKAELLGEVVRFVLNDAGEWMSPLMQGAQSYRAALHLYISANMSYLSGHRTEILALTEVLANARATPGVPELFRVSQEEAIRALQSLFEGGQSAGEFGDVPARMLAGALRATIDSTSESMRSDPNFDLGLFERDLLVLFDRATAPNKPGTPTAPITPTTQGPPAAHHDDPQPARTEHTVIPTAATTATQRTPPTTKRHTPPTTKKQGEQP